MCIDDYIFTQTCISNYESMTGSKVAKCGLVVDEATPMLGASPDGLIFQNPGMKIFILKVIYLPHCYRHIYADKKLSFSYYYSDLAIDGEWKECDGLLEVKTVPSCDHLTISEAVDKVKGFWLVRSPESAALVDNTSPFRLKTTHKYYDQIQLQLHLTGQ
jgi:hypothetical protein